MTKEIYQACALGTNEHNCYYFECPKRNQGCKQFELLRKGVEFDENGKIKK